MLYAKAFALGVLAGVLAPVVAGVASFGCAWAGGWHPEVLMSIQFGPRAHYFIFPHSGGPPVPLESCRFPVSAELAIKELVAAFAVGFVLTLWRAMVKSQGRKSN